MALNAAISGINAFFGIAGVGLGIGSIVLQQQLKEYSKKMKDEIDKNSELIDSSKKFQDTIRIINSPVLKTQQSKVDIVLKANLEQIQQYYESLRQLMIQQKAD